MSEEPSATAVSPDAEPATRDGATDAPTSERAPPSPEKGSKRRRPSTTFLIVLVFLLVSQPLLLLVVLLPYWWAPLPILSVWGVLGWKRSWLWSLLVGFLLGFGYWGVQLLSLPAGPRAKLAVIIANGIGTGTPVAVAYLLGPLLFGLLAALAALTVAGGLRLWEDLRPRASDAPAQPKAGSEA